MTQHAKRRVFRRISAFFRSVFCAARRTAAVSFAFLLCLFCLLSGALPLSAAAFAEEAAPSAKAFRYYDSRTFCDFAGIETPALDAQSAVAVNLETGSVMFEKAPDDPIFPASTVKLMTALVAFENIPDLDVMIYASENAVKLSTGTRISSSKPLKAGEGLTARELLYALLITGANDAANVLAEYVGGSIEGFCKMMNDKAESIGASRTVFKNPTGLHDPEMVSTAHDIALIAENAYYVNELVKIAGSTNYTIESTNKTSERRYLYNRNRMLRRVEGEPDYFYKGALGLSAGSTPEGGSCVVALASREGLTYLTVAMNAASTESENFAYRDSVTMLDICFDNFSVRPVVRRGDILCEIPVALAEGVDHLTLHAENDISALLPVSLDEEKDIFRTRQVYEDAKAPVSEGQAFGELRVSYKTVSLGSTRLVADTYIDRSNFLYLLDLLRRFFGSKWFLTALVTAIVLFIIYCFFYYKAQKRRTRRPRYRR